MPVSTSTSTATCRWTADAFVFVDDVPRVTTGTLGGRVGGEAYADGRSLADE